MATKLLIFLLLCGSALAQLPVVPNFNYPPAAASAFTPESLGGMYLHFIYTNLPTSGSCTDWVDLVQGMHVKWNQANVAPTCTTTGILSKQLTGARDCLTNGLPQFGTNYSFFVLFNQIGGFGLPGEFTPIFADINSSGNRTFGPSAGGANPDTLFVESGQNPTIVTGPNAKWVDAYCTISNGVFWSWTNGVINNTALNFVNVPWASGLSFLSDNDSSGVAPWHGTLAEWGVYTNLPFTTTIVSNLHRYITNVPVASPISP